MKYQLTQHAKDVLADRGIALAWVERTLDAPARAEPDPADPDLEHRWARITEYGDRVLRVILNRATTPPRVVTAFFDRGMRERL